jgi:hypothetical protein
MKKIINLAQQSLEEQEFLEAAKKIKQLAEQGHVQAQLRLGMLYVSGKGVQLNYVIAAQWFAKAAAQKVAEAQSYLGWLYANGYGVEQNDKLAGNYYLQAAEEGLAKDQYLVGTMYRWGRYGVEIDLPKMLEWYQRAAQQGYAPAQYTLGQFLSTGEFILKDEMLAFQWLSLAAVNGSKSAKSALAELITNMSPEQVKQAQQQMLQVGAKS